MSARAEAPVSAGRTGLAGLAAAAAAPVPFLALDPVFYAAAFMVALLHALLLGLPFYFRLSRTRRLTLPASLGWSFLIGAAPITLFAASVLLWTSVADKIWAGSAQAVEFTLHLWLQLAVSSVLWGLFGMLGGSAFWLIMRRHGAPRGRGPASLPI